MIAATPVLEAIAGRRAVRAYTDAVVPADTVHALLHAAVEAPTAMHLEPWAFVVVQDRELLRRISDRAKELFGRRPEHGGLVRSSDGPVRTFPPGFNIFYDAGTLIAICARPLGAFGTADCWLAAQNLMLAAYALGYGTCPIGFAVPALDDPEVKAMLEIPDDVTAVAPIIVGVARAEPPRQPRREPVILSWK